MKQEKTVESYIANSAYPAALKRLRKIVLQSPLRETVKWGSPCYTYDGKNIVGIVAFKSYFGLWFHQGALLADPAGVLINAQKSKTKAQRQWRMTSAEDIDEERIRRYVEEAVGIAKAGEAIKPDKAKPLRLPPELSAALRNDAALSAAFKKLRLGLRRDYADYIADAKRAETKARRLEKIKPMILTGAGLNDKYR